MQHIKGKKKLILRSYIGQTHCKIQAYTQKSTSVLDTNSKLLSIMSYNNEATESKSNESIWLHTPVSL